MHVQQRRGRAARLGHDADRARGVERRLLLFDRQLYLRRFRDQYNLAIQDTATAYGFGAETGVPLPAEQEGRVPTPEQKQAAHDQNPKAFPFGKWSPATTSTSRSARARWS